MKRENETLLDLVERLKNHFEEQVSVVPKVKSGMSGMVVPPAKGGFRLAKSLCLAEFAKSFRLGGSFVKDMMAAVGGRPYPRRSRSCCRADFDVLLTARS